jgi:hypothetical protein
VVLSQTQGCADREGKQHARSIHAQRTCGEYDETHGAASEPHAMEMKQAPLMAQKPTEEEVQVAEVFLVALDSPPAPDLPESLPTTASFVLETLGPLRGVGIEALVKVFRGRSNRGLFTDSCCRRERNRSCEKPVPNFGVAESYV